MEHLQEIIDQAWEDRAQISPAGASAEVRNAVNETIDQIDRGALRVAEKINVQKLVLVAPAVGRFAMPLVPATTLLIHGEMDEIVPLTDVLAWARKQHLHIVLVPEATHFFHGHLHQIKAIVSQHFTGHTLSL